MYHHPKPSGLSSSIALSRLRKDLQDLNRSEVSTADYKTSISFPLQPLMNELHLSPVSSFSSVSPAPFQVVSSTTLVSDEDSEAMSDSPGLPPNPLASVSKTILNVHVSVTPLHGPYHRSHPPKTFNFSVLIPPNFPFKPPRVVSLCRIYHPNVCPDGTVLLPVLGSSWRPVMSLSSLVMAIGLMFLSVSDPTPTTRMIPGEPTSCCSQVDSCVGNARAYEMYKNHRHQFSSNVEISISGGTIDGVYYEAASYASRKRGPSVEEEVDMSQQSLECMHINEEEEGGHETKRRKWS